MSDDHDNPTQHAARAWAEATEDFCNFSVEMSELYARFVGKTLSQLPEDMRRNLDEKSFGQVGRLAGDLAEYTRRLADGFSAPDFSEVDPARFQQLWQGMFDEYRRDLDGLSAESFQVDLQPLTEAWSAVLQGTADSDAHTIVHRFVDALSVKARLGAEYYADPNNVEVAPTPKELVHENGAFQLFRFRREGAADFETGPPVLIVYSVINRSYILDLTKEMSFVAHLLEQGIDLYLIEWGEHQAGDHETSLDDFIERGIGASMDHIRDERGVEKVALFGHCIGGTFAAMYAALCPEKVDRLFTLTAPFTRPERGVLATMTDPSMLPIDQLVDGFGQMPAKLIRYTFMGLKPYYELMKWKMFVENLGNDDAMARFAIIDKWANDNVDIPAEVFRSFIRQVFHEDGLVCGTVQIGGCTVDLARIECPVLNLAGKGDWIVPPDSAAALGGCVSSEFNEFRTLPGSHLSLILDPRLRSEWDGISDFLAGKGRG